MRTRKQLAAPVAAADGIAYRLHPATLSRHLSIFNLVRATGLSQLFSQDCQLCGVRATGTLCAACADELPRWSAGGCPCCGEQAAPGQLCGACLAHPPAFDATVAAYRYAFPLDRLVQSFKFNANLALADLFASALAQAAGCARPDTLIALPLANKRLAERGFNQSALLAERVARRLGIEYAAHGLLKVRDTPPQAGLNRRARLKNVRGAFASDASLAGRHVALVDDVMTTGATLSEAAKALKKAGAATVTAWVVARAPMLRHDGAFAGVGEDSADDTAVPF